MDNKEKYIIDQINNHRESVDTNDLWAAVVGSIPQEEEKKRRGVLWFWGGLLMIGAIGILFYQLERFASLNSDTKDELLVHNRNENAKALSEVSESNKKNEILNKSITSIDGAVPNDIYEIEANNRRLITAKKSGTQARINQDVNSKSDFHEKKKSNQALRNQLEQTKLNYEKIDISKNSGIESGILQQESPKTSGRNGSSDIIMNLISTNFTLLEYKREEISIKQEPFINTDLKIERFEKVDRFRFFANTGASYIVRQLSTDDVEYFDKRNRRNQIEAVLGGWNITVGLTYRLGPALSLGTGISLSQIYEKATFTTTTLISGEGDQVTEIVYTQDGAVNYKTENVITSLNRTTNEIRYNSLKYFSIPLILKYRLVENKTYKLSLNGNASYLLSQRYSGFTSLDENESSYNLSKDQNNDFARSGGMSFGYGMDVSRRIVENWDINLGFGVNYLQGISSYTNPIDQKYTTYRISLGICRRI